MSINYKNKKQFIDYSLAILLASIPLPVGISNIALGLFIVSILINFKELNFKISNTKSLPIIYYLVCVISLIWTYDIDKTLNYLIKGIFFIVIPVFFFFIPKLDHNRRTKILNQFSYITTIQCIFFLINAIFRYISTLDMQVFFYHELVTLEVNAVYVSIIVSLAFFNLLIQKDKKILDKICVFILLTFLILLSSKNILAITIVGIIIYVLTNLKSISKKTLITTLIIGTIVFSPLSYKAFERYKDELKDYSENVDLNNNVINVSVKNAWNQDVFTDNYFFNGTAFRIYQARIFKEILEEDNRCLTGYGAGAIQDKITEEIIDDDLPEYYWKLNFHNQYLQTFATLGILGFIILIIINTTNIIKSIKNRDLYFLFFTMLSISIMFTESIFERQRGIVFFTIFYCLLHSTIKKELPR